MMIHYNNNKQLTTFEQIIDEVLPLLWDIRLSDPDIVLRVVSEYIYLKLNHFLCVKRCIDWCVCLFYRILWLKIRKWYESFCVAKETKLFLIKSNRSIGFFHDKFTCVWYRLNKVRVMIVHKFRFFKYLNIDTLVLNQYWPFSG